MKIGYRQANVITIKHEYLAHKSYYHVFQKRHRLPMRTCGVRIPFWEGVFSGQTKLYNQGRRDWFGYAKWTELVVCRGKSSWPRARYPQLYPSSQTPNYPQNHKHIFVQTTNKTCA